MTFVHSSSKLRPKAALVGLVAILGLALAAPSVAQSAPAGAGTKASVSAKAHVSKKKCKASKKKCKKARRVQTAPAPAPTPAAPAPLALTASEAYTRADDRAYYEYLIDPYAIDWGVDVCYPVTAHQWNCWAYNIEYYAGDYYSCDWLEVVQRTGYNGVTSNRSGDFDCYPI